MFLNEEDILNYKKAGRIAAEALVYAKRLIKIGASDLEIVNKMDEFFEKKGVKKAFPVTLSVNEVAAHYTPFKEEYFFKENDIIKIDLGIKIGEYLADNALTVYLGKDELLENLKLSSKEALFNVRSLIRNKLLEEGTIKISEIGSEIERTIKSYGFNPIYNLGGHSIEKNKLHAGIFIPNYNNNSPKSLKEGIYAIEPFASTAQGKVREGPFSNILILLDYKRLRIPLLYKKIYENLKENFGTTPFSMLDLEKLYPNEAEKIANTLERYNLIYKYPQLIEDNSLISQHEFTFMIKDDKAEVITNWNELL